MKKIMSILLSAVMLFCMSGFPCSVKASGADGISYTNEEVKKADRFEYFIRYEQYHEGCEIKGNVLYITRCYDEFGDELTIPDEIDGIKIHTVAIGDYGKIKTLVLADGIKAVSGWNGGYFPNKEVQEYLHERGYNSNIQTLYAGKSFEECGLYMIREGSGFSKLKMIYISEDNPNLASYKGVAFSNDLKRVIFCPRKRFSQKDNTFSLPKHKVEEIDECAFEYTKLKKLKNVLSLRKIGDSAFAKSNLESFKICKKAQIDEYSFACCYRLKKVVFYTKAEDMTNIPWHCFENCKKLKTVYMRKITKAPRMDDATFMNTPSGIKFYVKDKKIARQLKKEITRKKGIGVRKAKIYAGKKLVYKNVSSKKGK